MDKPIFHACELNGDPDHILNVAPFLSEDNDRQWLTQGYYFWIEDVDLAHRWGSKSVKGDYVILHASLELETEEHKHNYLDLISSPLHIKYFKTLIGAYLNEMKEKLGRKYEPTISEVINHYRILAEEDFDAFPFIGISCCDDSTAMKRKFINSHHSKELLALNERHQICIFKGFESTIQNKIIAHPEKWCA